ncbi:MAG: ribonuclease III [Anaerolineae bacterium]|nr:ribonuclease III [Anaerolineae bacterium]
MNLIEFQDANSLTFEDLALLRRALIHPSYLNENPLADAEDNQRLEFLGDAVLDFVVGEMLYNRFTEEQEGRLTRLRSALVRTETLASLALRCQINEVLLVGHGEEETHGRERISNLCAAFEAVIGAIYLDQGLAAVTAFATPHFEQALNEVLAHEYDKDPKSRLQEWCQKNLKVTPVYEIVESSGPDHARTFRIAVLVESRPIAEGIGRSKRSAAQDAAAHALATLTQPGSVSVL